MCSFTDSDLPDTDNIVPLENTTLNNQNKKGKYKTAEQVDQINWDKSVSANERTHTDQQKN